MNDIMLIECTTEFVGLNESSKRKEGDKYSYNILSWDNGRMMIPLKEEEEGKKKKKVCLKKIPRLLSKMGSEMN